MSKLNKERLHPCIWTYLVADNTGDLFICGKCHANFTDLNRFLTHRSTCNVQNLTELFPLVTSPSTALLEGELDAIIQDVSLTIPASTNLFYTDVPPTNEFDLLFSQPVEQTPTITQNLIDHKNDLSIETSMSQMSLLECPVCDEQFEAPTILEDHVFEHSTFINDNESIQPKPGVTYDDSSSSYTDLLDETSTSTLECKQCTVTFTSNASLSIHKKMSMFCPKNYSFRM